jgi:hypothetical protein
MIPGAMAPGMKRALDYLAYTVSAAALGGGAVYAVHQLKPAPAPAPAVASAPAATDAAVPAPPATDTPQPPAPPPATAAPQPPRPAPATTVAAPEPSGGVLTTAHGSYTLPAAAASPQQDRATYLALQRNCYAAAANNQTGRYPALQSAACNRYAEFAGEHGWNIGALPAYGQAPPPAPAAPDYAVAEPGYQEQPELVVYGGDAERYHRLHPQRRFENQPGRQIGPNYALPPPQAQPPVSQQQRHAGGRAQPYH